MKKISPARTAAFEILLRIETEKAFTSVLLPIYEETLTKKDAALCHELTLGVLRKKIYLDKVITKFTKKSLAKFDNEVLISLRLGLYQLFCLERVPAYSAINESVNLVKVAKKKSASGLVNAVLRRASKEKIDLHYSTGIEKISVETSHPKWLIEKWVNKFGVETASRVAEKNNDVPDMSFRVTAKFYKKEKAEQSSILSELKTEYGVVESDFIKDCFIAERFNEKCRELAKQNLIYFQDSASQMIPQIIDIKSEESFIDICAAPGSKFTQIDITLNAKALRVTGDYFRHRIETLRRNCKKQEVDHRNIVQYDAKSTLPFKDGSFDVVLVDAPCSGTGTIRHNPEIRYFLNEKDFVDLSSKQLTILQNASKLIKRGGRIIYSTCSLETEENEEVVQQFLSANQNYELVKPCLPEKFLTADGYLRTSPNRDEMDGFFAAILYRRD